MKSLNRIFLYINPLMFLLFLILIILIGSCNRSRRGSNLLNVTGVVKNIAPKNSFTDTIVIYDARGTRYVYVNTSSRPFTAQDSANFMKQCMEDSARK